MPDNMELRIKKLEELLKPLQEQLKKLSTPEAEQKLEERKWGAYEVERDLLMSVIICPEKINPNLIEFTPELEQEIAQQHHIRGISWSHQRSGLDYYRLTPIPEKEGKFPYRRLEITSYGLIEFSENTFSDDKQKPYVPLDRIEYLLPSIVSFMTNLLLKVKFGSGNSNVYFIFTLHKIKDLRLLSYARNWQYFPPYTEDGYKDGDTLTIKLVKDINEINRDVKGFCEQIILKTCRAFNVPVKGRWEWREYVN